MDKVMIVGGFEFLSFHLSTRFLEQGYVVQSIGFENSDDLFLEEKRFTLGRNANLIKTPIREWIKEGLPCDCDSIVIISLFDLFLKKESEKMLSHLEEFASKLSLMDQFKPGKVVFLLPIQEEDEARNTLGQIEEKLIHIIKQKALFYHIIALPTLYGPWQPLEYAFQQVLYHDATNRKDIHVDVHEWIYDAIFIDDAVREIVELIDTDKPENYILKNKTEDTWKKCAEKLGIHLRDFQDPPKTKLRKLNYIIREIEAKVDFEQGLILQKQHLLKVITSV